MIAVYVGRSRYRQRLFEERQVTALRVGAARTLQHLSLSTYGGGTFFFFFFFFFLFFFLLVLVRREVAVHDRLPAQNHLRVP